MENYFVFRLLVDLVISAVLLRLLALVARKFKKRYVSQAYLIYLPTLVSLILIFQIVFFMGPKLIDVVRLVGGGMSFAQIEVSETRQFPGALTDSDGKRFYYNPLGLKAEIGDRYTVRYLPTSRFIIHIESSEQLPVNSNEGDN